MRYDKKEIGLAVLSSISIILMTFVLVKMTEPQNGYAIREPRIFFTAIISIIFIFVFYDFFLQPYKDIKYRTYIYATALFGVLIYVLGRTINGDYKGMISTLGLLLFLIVLFFAIIFELANLSKKFIFNKIKIKMPLKLKAFIFSLIFAAITFVAVAFIYILGTEGNWKLNTPITPVQQTTTDTGALDNTGAGDPTGTGDTTPISSIPVTPST